MMDDRLVVLAHDTNVQLFMSQLGMFLSESRNKLEREMLTLSPAAHDFALNYAIRQARAEQLEIVMAKLAHVSANTAPYDHREG